MTAIVAIALTLGATAAEPEIPAAAADLGKGMHLYVEREVDVSAAAMWSVLAHDYVGIDAWSTMVATSREMTADDLPEGTTADPDAPVIGRIVRTKGGEVLETLVDYDDDARTFTFRGGNLPRFLAYSQNTHRVEDIGDGRARVSFDVYLVPKGIAKLMRGKIEKRFSEMLGHHIEEAEDHAQDRSAGGAS